MVYNAIVYKNILYYSKNKNNSVYSQLFNIASKYKLKLLLASNATSFFSKYKNSGVIIFNKSEIKEVIRLVSLMEKNSAFYCQIEDVDQVINNYKEMCRLLSQTKANISAFLDNINLPPIYTANIIIKQW